MDLELQSGGYMADDSMTDIRNKILLNSNEIVMEKCIEY